MNSLISSSRGVDKYTSIATEIRRRIANGQLMPGSQLPQRTELEESFQVSKVTLQRAMNLLIEDGFIDATRRKGSFVVARPPHLSRYALVFQGAPGGTQSWSRFWMALSNEAAWRERQDEVSIPIFYGIDGHIDTNDYQKLAMEVEEHRVAGVIYVAAYPRRPDLSLLKRTGVPGVTVQSSPNEGVPCVTIDEESFVFKALNYLRERGRRRVAFVCPPEYAERQGEFLQQQVAAFGMETRPYWIQGVGLDMPSAARNCVHLLMNPSQNERPDALVITDDNLTEAATIGLLAAGINVPGEVEVVGHANFPWKTPCVVEARRLGYDVRPLLGACLQSIDAQRSGHPAPQLIKMPAQFEDELAV
ncbi:GntR family transcriptional regulator [Abditibacterium utsteinense]|uniref:GntR family transcriptional regulator n=1 Tax=Abditibacterium utsteinense TaxID=1960156 RepID=UPI000F462AFF|nr:GntR family transcriptional regulator [Abditibacterium utsteinense]